MGGIETALMSADSSERVSYLHELQTQGVASEVFNALSPSRDDFLRDGSILKEIGPLGKLLSSATTESQKEAILDWLRTSEESPLYEVARERMLNSIERGYLTRRDNTGYLHGAVTNAHREFHSWPLEIQASLVEVILLRATPAVKIPTSGKNILCDAPCRGIR